MFSSFSRKSLVPYRNGTSTWSRQLSSSFQATAGTQESVRPTPVPRLKNLPRQFTSGLGGTKKAGLERYLNDGLVHPYKVPKKIRDSVVVELEIQGSPTVCGRRQREFDLRLVNF
jgi:hypothetical protein